MTIKEIANKLNVSIATISRVANNKENVSPATREKILEAFEQYNYVPNELARSLKSNSTKLVGLVVDDIFEHIENINIIEEIFRENGYNIILCNTQGNAVKENACVELLIKRRVDGVIMFTLKGSAYEKFADINIPVVHGGSIREEEIDSLEIDGNAASRMATEHILKKGHEKIAFVTEPLFVERGFNNLIGYRLAIHDGGFNLNENIIKHCENTINGGKEAFRTLLKEDFSAIYCTSKKITTGVLCGINESGFNIANVYFLGSDVSQSFDGTPLEYVSTTSLGKGACEILLNKLISKQKRRIQQKIQPYIVEMEG